MTKNKIRKCLSKLYHIAIMIFYNTIVKLWIKVLGTRDKRKLQYKVSLCLIFKDEAPFLKEWIDYHLLVGIDHFYLYNNNSRDNYLDVIGPYQKKGLITLIEWPEQFSQFKAYKHCYEKYRNETNWISFLDADEFFVPRRCATISEWLIPFSKYPAVMVHWRMFGTNGIIEHDYNKNVIEQYFSCWDEVFPFGKCLINTRFDISDYFCWHVHHHVYMKYKFVFFHITIPAINQFKYICTVNHTWGGGKNKMESSSMLINHYYTKAWNIYQMKIKRGDVLYKSNPRSNIEKFYQQEMKCVKHDYTIQRFFIKLRNEQM